LTVVSVLVQGKTVLCDESAEIGSVHDKEQKSETPAERHTGLA